MNKNMEKQQINGPLFGVRVLEYGVFHAGPGATAILGDLGATVIKIEEEKGDPERFWTSVGGLDISGPNGESFMFDVSNRNKKGICINIRTPKGRAIFEKLVSKCNVFLTNLRKSTKKKMGLDYETLKKINPEIIHANVSGYGKNGPFSDMGAFDPMGQARSGMMFLHNPDEPSLIHLAILDQATAICASHAILTALFFKERHGQGQEVHTSLYGTGLWLCYANLVMTSIFGVDPSISWVRFENSPLRNNFKCKDGKWIIGVHHPESKYWGKFCEATGQTQMADDSRYQDSKLRQGHCKELVDHFDKILATKTRDEWMEIFSSHGLMFSPVQNMSDVIMDPQALANNYVVEFEHPALGNMKIPGYPNQFSSLAAGTKSVAPKLGEHTDEVLLELGLSQEEINNLRQEGIIQTHDK